MRTVDRRDLAVMDAVREQEVLALRKRIAELIAENEHLQAACANIAEEIYEMKVPR